MKNRCLRSFFLLVCGCLILSACASPRKDIEYCRGYFGEPGNYNFGMCVKYYNQQPPAFYADLATCNRKADEAYPFLSYDGGDIVPVNDRISYTRGIYASGLTLQNIPPDYKHNAEVDAKRISVVAPCMAEHGWNPPPRWREDRKTPSE